MNYRSVVILGTLREIVDPTEKVAALKVIVEHTVPNRWRMSAGPTSRN
jgi:nitroimidazol reductase NimA-like FMN-containing flavoprotein (pyridoxamine 5'-phosphate oxidase superfamily)